MFNGCASLKEVPTIPKGVMACYGMFAGCSKEVQEAGNWNVEHRGKDYYTDDSGNKSKPKITDPRIMKAMMNGERVLVNEQMQSSQKGLGE